MKGYEKIEDYIKDMEFLKQTIAKMYRVYHDELFKFQIYRNKKRKLNEFLIKILEKKNISLKLKLIQKELELKKLRIKEEDKKESKKENKKENQEEEEELQKKVTKGGNEEKKTQFEETKNPSSFNSYLIEKVGKLTEIYKGLNNAKTQLLRGELCHSKNNDIGIAYIYKSCNIGSPGLLVLYDKKKLICKDNGLKECIVAMKNFHIGNDEEEFKAKLREGFIFCKKEQ